MNGFFYDLSHNQLLIAALAGFVTAQVVKTIIHLVVHRQLVLERLLGDGGMPSAHSATVTATALTALLEYGPASPVFAIALILAIIVMHDARGVRRETGKQAVIINEMMELFERMGSDMPMEERLKELVGHSPLQVFMGAMVGLVVGAVVHQVL